MSTHDPVGLENRITRLEADLFAAREALKLQAREYERRLVDLNHEASRLLAAQAATVPRGEWEIEMREMHSWRAAVNAQLTTMAAKADLRRTDFVALVSLAGVVIAIVLGTR